MVSHQVKTLKHTCDWIGYSNREALDGRGSSIEYFRGRSSSVVSHQVETLKHTCDWIGYSNREALDGRGSSIEDFRGRSS